MPSTLDYPIDLIARVLHARLRGSSEARIQRVTTDSRQIQPGDLFVALSGENFDGHQFVSDALKNGAVGAVVSGDRLAPVGHVPKGAAVLEVRDPLQALGRLAAWHRNRCGVKVVGVTGSVGKTTTKDLLANIVAEQFRVLKSPGNLNAEIGLPLTLLQLTPEHEVAVVEMAMRGKGQIQYLAEIARPDIAVITYIGLSHLELLGSRDSIAEAKAEILDYLPFGGAAILNADDGYFPFLAERVPPGVAIHTFGAEQPGQTGVSGGYLGTGPKPGEKSGSGAAGTRFTLRGAKGQAVRWGWIPLLGRHNMMNALAAAAAAQALGVSWPRIIRGLADAEVSSMRMAVHRLRDGSLLIDDAYNASSPEAVLGALEVLGELPGLRKIAILGSMLELGGATEEAHRQVGRAAVKLEPSLLLTVGEPAQLIAETAVANGLPEERALVCASNEEALEQVRSRRRAGDVILVKGSRGVAMESIVRSLLAEGTA